MVVDEASSSEDTSSYRLILRLRRDEPGPGESLPVACAALFRRDANWSNSIFSVEGEEFAADVAATAPIMPRMLSILPGLEESRDEVDPVD